MTREPDPTGFDAIVASWRAEGDVPSGPRTASTSARRRSPSRAAVPSARTAPTRRRPVRRPPRHATAATRDRRRPTAPDEHSGQQRPEPTPPPGDPDARPDEAATRRPSDRPTGRRESAAEPVADEHFVPPEPPPLPRHGAADLVGLTLIALGLVLVTFPGWVGVPQVYGLPLGLVAIAAGLGWLVLRLWPDPDDVPPPLYLDDPDDPDGGAVL